MGIFGQRDSTKGRRSQTTVISDGTRFVGELSLESNLHLDGQIKGTIVSDHDVSVGHTGRFEGNLKAERLLVSGYVEGVIDCASLEIVAEGRVFGELHSDEFVIAPGGQFLGESHPRRDTSQAALGHERPAEAAAQRLTPPTPPAEAGSTPPAREPRGEGPPAQQAAPAAEAEPTRHSPPPEEEEAERAEAEAETEAEQEADAEPPQEERPAPRQTFWGRR